MAIKKDENWVDSRGREVPVKYIPAFDKKRDDLVEKMFKRAEKIEKTMLEFKALLWDEIEKYIQSITEGSAVSENWKGNLTLTGFSGTKQIEVDVKDLISFDERLNVAKQIIDECLKRWSGDSNDRIKTIVNEAFNIDKKGKVNSYLILRLTKLDMKDEEWSKAMQLIKDSIRPTNTRKYVCFKYRDCIDGEWQTMNLNFSSI